MYGILRAISVTAILASMFAVGYGSQLARASTGSVSFVGSSLLSGPALEVETGDVYGPYLGNYKFPDGGNSSNFGVLFNAFCNNAKSAGTTDYSSSCTGGGTTGVGVKTCSGNSCPPGPNDDDYCDQTTVGDWDCGAPTIPPVPGYTVPRGATEPYTSQTQSSGSCVSSTTPANDGASFYIDNNSHVLSPVNPCLISSGIQPVVVPPPAPSALAVTFTPIPANAYRVALYLTNPAPAPTSGCLSVAVDGSTPNIQTVASLPSGSGEFLEWSATAGVNPSTLDISESTGCAGGIVGDVDLSGVFILPTTPTGLDYRTLTVHHSHGWTRLSWRSTRSVAGYNLYVWGRRLNHRLIVGRAGWYRFRIHRVLHHISLIAVPIRR